MEIKSRSTLLVKKNETNQAWVAELEKLTGCPVSVVIEQRCNDAACPNSTIAKQLTAAEFAAFCARVRQIVSQGPPASIDINLSAPKESTDPFPRPIIETRPRNRCIL